jgi:hypothetical protein
MAFSGVLYPDYDFEGQLLQDLSQLKEHLELLTFCSAPTARGWGFLFAWHESSCYRFVQSLAEAARSQPLEDLLFRMALSCENHAISPQWWESLPTSTTQMIDERMTEMADLHVRTPNYCLTKAFRSGSSPR